MNIEQSASFLIGSLLTGLGAIVVTATIVIINNIVHKYWKNLGWFKGWFEHKQFILSEDEYNRIAPYLDQPVVVTKNAMNEFNTKGEKK
jgi:hypothetical protein